MVSQKFSKHDFGGETFSSLSPNNTKYTPWLLFGMRIKSQGVHSRKRKSQKTISIWNKDQIIEKKSEQLRLCKTCYNFHQFY